MILALVFAAFAASAAEPTIVDKVLSVNEKVQMNSCQCDAAPYVTPSTDSSDKNICSVLTQFRQGDPKKFDVKNPYGLCAPVWKTATPSWKTPAGAQLSQIYASSDFKPSSRTDYLKSTGRKVLEGSKRTALVSQTIGMRETAAKTCCGTDADCLKAMRAVRVTVCESASDSDPNLPDDCQGTVGSYNLSARENAVMALVMKDSAQVALGLQTDTLKAYLAEGRALAGDFLAQYEFPASGEIRLSPYLEPSGVPVSEPTTLRHEFGHACSFIRRQLAARPGQPDGERNAMSFFQMKGLSCALDNAREESSHGALLRRAGVPSSVGSCIIDLANQSVVPTSSAYIPNSCQANKVEEATADVFAFYTMPLSPDGYPTRACGRVPSKIHPAPVDVLSCILKGDAKKLSELNAKFHCKAER